MNTKVRQNCFETNSSSTHSVTIRNRCKAPDDVKPILEEGVLYPKRLNQFSHSIGSDGSSMVCNTRDMKAALLLSWIQNLFEEDYDDELEGASREAYIDYTLETLGYSGVNFEDDKYGNFPNSEYEDNLSFSGDWEEDKEQIDNIIKYVNDDNVEIADEDIPY